MKHTKEKIEVNHINQRIISLLYKLTMKQTEGQRDKPYEPYDKININKIANVIYRGIDKGNQFEQVEVNIT